MKANKTLEPQQTIVITLSDMLSREFQTCLGTLAAISTLPAATSWRLSKLINKMESEAVSVEKAFAALRQKYGTKMPDGTYRVYTPQDKDFIDTDEKRQAYNDWAKERDQLLSENLTFEWSAITFDELSTSQVAAATVSELRKYGIVAE